MENAKNSKKSTSEKCSKIKDHNHVHGENCGHKAVQHGDHVDYIHDGHRHKMHGGHVDECSSLSV